MFIIHAHRRGPLEGVKSRQALPEATQGVGPQVTLSAPRPERGAGNKDEALTVKQ